MRSSALLTDYYELTMMQGFYLAKVDPEVVFDMFYRTNPFGGGYAVFTGLNDVLESLEGLSFSKDDIAYLRGLGAFDESFLEYLSGFKFSGSVYAMAEGTVVFPGEVLVRIHSHLIEAQLIESMLLNKLNFQTLIATKAARVCMAAGSGAVMEFGLRRAQGPDGASSASRAAYIGGCAVTSNTLAGKRYGIPVSGTMAHSWVMAYPSELEAFRAFAKIYPSSCVLLIDTYDTLGSGIDNAIKVGLEQKAKGFKIGVRIDSGDLSYLSRAVRSRLDAAGLHDATICVSNDLTEEIIKTLVDDEAPIDTWGVGTQLATGGTNSSLNGVYKMSAKQEADGTWIPTMKLSNTYEKTTNPGIKQVYRFFDLDGQALADYMALESEAAPCPGNDYMFCHPFSDSDFFKMKKSAFAAVKALLQPVMIDGARFGKTPSINAIKKSVKENLDAFHQSYKRFINPHIYKVSLSSELKELKHALIVKAKEDL